MGEAVPKPSYPKPLRFRAGAFIGTGTRPENLGADEAVHRDPIDGNGAVSLRPAGPGQGRSCHTAIDAIGSAPYRCRNQRQKWARQWCKRPLVINEMQSIA